MGGTGCCPTYSNYTSNNNFSETLRLVYDNVQTNFTDLLNAYWTFVPDPGMGCDDPAYCPRIFYVDETQRSLAAASITAHNFKINDPMGVALLPASEFTFWKGEESNQHFDQKMGQPCNGQGRAKVRGRTRR